jgi:hypothetical protein
VTPQICESGILIEAGLEPPEFDWWTHGLLAPVSPPQSIEPVMPRRKAASCRCVGSWPHRTVGVTYG